MQRGTVVMEMVDIKNGGYLYKTGGNKNLHRKYEITFNTASEKVYNNGSYLMPFFENEIVKLKLNDEREINCFVSYKEDKKVTEDIFFSKKIKDSIGGNTEIISIESNRHIKVKRPMLAAVDNVKHSKVEIMSPNIWEDGDKIIRFDDSKFTGIRIVNNLNGASIYVDKKNIAYKHHEKDNKIHLNHEQRMMLDLELPTFINKYYLDTIKKDKQCEGAEANNQFDFNKYYQSEEENICYSRNGDYITVKNGISKALLDCKTTIYQLAIYPVYNEKNTKKSIPARLIGAYLKWQIRNKTKTKVVIRPYSIDESDNVVHLTSNSLNQIGVDESDFIILRNPINNKELRVKAMPIDDEEAILQENRINSNQHLNICVGVSAHIRNALELESINQIVEIERDLKFIFKKHLNSQIQSLIGVFLSFIALKDIIEYELIVLALSVILLIILIFVSFSDIRERIDE